jgi:Leucine-rich repeat (LRR) protein
MMLIRTVFISVLMLFLSVCWGQLLSDKELSQQVVYTSLQEAFTVPDQVYILNLRSKDLKSLPDDIEVFTNLQYLDVSKNDLLELPKTIVNLKNLAGFIGK